MPCIIHVTDIHGNLKFCERLFAAAAKKKVAGILIGGDIAPSFGSTGQRVFLEQYFVKRIEKFRDETKIPVFVIMGNDDHEANADVLKKAHRNGVLKYVEGRKEKLADFFVIGYPFVNPTPFLLKDWEKKEQSIEEDLERMTKRADPKKAIMLFHAPPYGTKLDILHYGTHCGSISIRKFIERYQPYLTLHGHIHESPQKSGMISDRIGNTMSMNPGSMKILMINLGNLNTNLID